MLRFLSLTLLCGLVAGAVAAETHPFSVNDMLAMARVSDPSVSPDGTLVVFQVSVTNLEKNKRDSDLHLAAIDGSWHKHLTTHAAGDSQPRWSPDGKTIYFVSSRSGSAQVWKIAVDGGEAQQVTKLPLDVDALAVAPGGGTLLFGMAVFPGKTPEETQEILEKKEKSKATGMLFDHLFVRHWDSWDDGTRNHVFAYDLAAGKATDLMGHIDADSPTKPFGGSEDFAVSPDGKTVVLSTKEMGANKSAEAWSTNFDLFEVPIDGTAAPRRITTNPAWDAQPRFSPDGKTLAYLAMSRPGYEADRFEIVLRNQATGAERKFTLRVDDSPRGDRSPGSLAWYGNGTLLVTADHLGRAPYSRSTSRPERRSSWSEPERAATRSRPPTTGSSTR